MLTKGADEQTKEAVYKFMAYWLSDDVLKEWSNRNGFPVWSYSVLEDADIQNNEILSAVSKASEIGRDWHLGLECGSMIDNIRGRRDAECTGGFGRAGRGDLRLMSDGH